MKGLMFRALLGLAVLVAIAAPASADTYNFGCITTNSATNCGIAQAQLSVSVTDAGGGLVSFVFNNSGPSASSIADVYFGYFGSNPGLLGGITTIVNGSGVSFSVGANPAALPGGNSATPVFHTLTALTADSNPPVQPNGVNPGETLQIIVQLNSGFTFQDVINSMNAGNTALGIHVQGFSNGGSESLVTTPNTPVPEPGTLALFGTGLVSLAGLIRRRLSA